MRVVFSTATQKPNNLHNENKDVYGMKVHVPSLAGEVFSTTSPSLLEQGRAWLSCCTSVVSALVVFFCSPCLFWFSFSFSALILVRCSLTFFSRLSIIFRSADYNSASYTILLKCYIHTINRFVDTGSTFTRLTCMRAIF